MSPTHSEPGSHDIITLCQFLVNQSIFIREAALGQIFNTLYRRADDKTTTLV